MMIARGIRAFGAGRLLPALLLGLLLLPSAAPAQTRVVPESREQIRLSFAPVVRRTAPAVVSITSRTYVEVASDPFASDPFFRFFFREFGVPARRERRTRTSLGSGVIVRGDGLVVTNNHVVADADEITVVLGDKREFEARILMQDEDADLAFLLLEDAPGDLPVLPLGDSDRLETGDLVLAIGNPFGIGQTVTSGIISAEARTPPGGSGEVSFLQTDAAINPGNSGGALVDLDGQLVGINTAIFTRGGGSIGIGFAIPANLVKARLLALERGGDFVAPWLGAKVQGVDAALAEALGLDRPRGVLVQRVHPASSAARGGLRPGDVILAVDGFAVGDPAGLNYRLALRAPGERMRFLIWRKGVERRLNIRLEAAPEDPPAEITLLRGRHPLEGARVANLSPALAERLGLDPFESGVVVLEITRRGFARRLGLRPGDRILAVNGREIAEVRALERVLAERRRRFDITIARGDRRFTLTVG